MPFSHHGSAAAPSGAPAVDALGVNLRATLAFPLTGTDGPIDVWSGGGAGDGNYPTTYTNDNGIQRVCGLIPDVAYSYHDWSDDWDIRIVGSTLDPSDYRIDLTPGTWRINIGYAIYVGHLMFLDVWDGPKGTGILRHAANSGTASPPTDAIAFQTDPPGAIRKTPSDWAIDYDGDGIDILVTSDHVTLETKAGRYFSHVRTTKVG